MEQEYKGWLVSNSFLKRSFAVFGHYLVASLIIAVPIWVLMFITLIGFSSAIK